ncbi:hypothetical protein C3489_06980 [Streptomyces sp. Ru71]|uniref:hypothetical protein n=1 Tax=Streptomyces sp. Ru71 TaxID=2080746 RepID=UPI000CDD9BA5|nr:hypothetical protein [Streptomyces sp. Ru71]POX56165.1 hypothetical protein C3489_06980 [Streptomyces sp. Ru71]
MKLKHTAVWVGCTAAALVATSACSAESAKVAAKSADQAMAALARVSDRTQQLGSAEIRTTTTLGAAGKPVGMDGTYSWGDGPAMDVAMDTAAARMSTLQDDPTTRVIMVDGAYYYGIDPQPRGPLKGKHWMRIDISALLGQAAVDNMTANADPTASLRSMRASTDVQDLGEETVLGKKVTHYRGSVDEEQVNKSTRLSAAEKKAVIQSLRAGGSKLTCDIWVDGKDLPVRMKQSAAGMTVTMDFLKFGATKPVTAPPAGDTGDLSEQVRKQREAAQGTQG